MGNDTTSTASTAVTLVTAIVAGAFGGCLSTMLTDAWRRMKAKRQTMRQFQQVRQKMPNLIAEMKASLKEQPTVRDFFVIPKGIRLDWSEDHFRYCPKEHDNLMGKVAILENMGYAGVRRGHPPKYRMTEEFVELVLKTGDED